MSVLLGAGGRESLEATWKDQLLPAAKELEKGFPFAGGDAETDLAKLTAYLNPESGDFSKFYKENAQKYFDGNPGQLKLKDTSTVKFSPEFIDYLNKMLLLREALFGKGATPNFEYEFKLSPVTDGILEGTIDGQAVKSDAPVKLKFPAAGGAETRCQYQLFVERRNGCDIGNDGSDTGKFDRWQH